MKPFFKTLVGLLFAGQMAHAAEPKVIELWPEGVPNAKANLPAEKVVDNRIVSVQKPSMLFFPADPTNATGTAVIFCSGGGYVRISVSKNGNEISHHLNSLGISVFMLKYRLSDYGYPAPFQDALRAIRIVRSRAAEFGVKPDHVGVMGASAGGHLAASAATMWDLPDGKTGAELDTVNARPDFCVLIYPVVTMADPFVHKGSRTALLGTNPPPDLIEKLSVEKHVRKDSPPVFLVATMADKTVPVENTLQLYESLRRANVPAEMHVYAQGSHGNSLDPQYGPTAEWPKRLEEWLRFNGWLTKAN